MSEPQGAVGVIHDLGYQRYDGPRLGRSQIVTALAVRGLAATTQARTLLVPLGGDDTYDVVRDCVAALALPLCRLEQRRHQVEELFRDGEEFQHA